jgi:hypothetical protein
MEPMEPMERTKANYIKLHPKSYLAQKLASNDWPDDTIIEIVGGQIAPKDKRSNLYKAHCLGLFLKPMLLVVKGVINPMDIG